MTDRSLPFLDRWVRYPLEAAAAVVLLGGMRLLTPERASDLGGWLGRTIGPRLGVGRWARRNLQIAFPDMPDDERERVLLGMWDNLGRVAGEYAHLDRICAPGSGRIESVGVEHLAPLRARGGFMVSGHLANWEVMVGSGINYVPGGFAAFVRSPNNPWIDPLVDRLRGAVGGTRIPKGAHGAMEALRLLRAGATIGLLVDQRLNDGIPVTFFGREAMTASVAAAMALRLGRPIVPVRCERLGPARFRLTAHPALPMPDGRDHAAATRAVMESIHRLLEDWIRERPSEWLWVHRRWPRDAYENA